MVYTLGEAAKATGKSKSTISKAIKNGRISASKGESGVYSIDPSELHRVYPIILHETGVPEQKDTLKSSEVDTTIANKIRELEIFLKASEQRLEDRDEQLSDIKEDRDKWRQQATALLEYKRPKGFWARVLGR
jgi:hypothetical protein